MYMYIFIYISMYISTYIYTYTYILMYIYMYILTIALPKVIFIKYTPPRQPAPIRFIHKPISLGHT